MGLKIGLGVMPGRCGQQASLRLAKGSGVAPCHPGLDLLQAPLGAFLPCPRMGRGVQPGALTLGCISGARDWAEAVLSASPSPGAARKLRVGMRGGRQMPALMEAGSPASGPAPPGLPRPGDPTVPAAETLRSSVGATCGGPGCLSGAHPWWQGLMGSEWPWASAPKPCSVSPADRTGPRGQRQGRPRPLLPGRAGAPLGLRGPTVPSSPVPTPFCGLMLCLRFPAAQFHPPPPPPSRHCPGAHGL